MKTRKTTLFKGIQTKSIKDVEYNVSKNSHCRVV